MHPRLPTLLVIVNVALIGVIVLGLGLVASTLIAGFADEQGLTRVAQSAQIAHHDIMQAAASYQTDAFVLAERPTLARLLIAENHPELSNFIEQFRHTSALDGVAVLRAQRVIASTRPFTATILTSHSPVIMHNGNYFQIVASAGVPNQQDAQVVIWRNLDARFVQGLSDTLMMPVSIREPLNASETTQSLVTKRIDNIYVSTIPLLGADQQVLGLIEVHLANEQIASASQRLISTLLILALSVGFIAALINSAIGRYIGTPLQRLTVAAARIGRGDLTTPVPASHGVEVGTLATTLEDMRRQLNTLTLDLRQQQAEATAILSGIVEGVYTVDRERRIHYLNRQAAMILNIEPQAAIGQFCGDVLRPLEQHGERPCLNNCPIIHARFRGTVRAVEHLTQQEGTQRTVIITSAGGHAGTQVQVIRDETEIEAARRLRDMLLATISHEFRTPLSAQLASLELLQDQLGQLSEEQIQQLLLSLQRGSLRLTYLIDNLLESARIEAGQLAIRRSTVALDAVIDDALDLMQPLLYQRRQRIDLDLPYPLPALNGDATRLTQVFVNLLANASKFAPEDTQIGIGGTVGATNIQVWIDDQGPGLPSTAGESPFHLFVRAKTEPEQSGTGLGLWIAQSIVERHGGRILVPTHEHGTRIIVELPRGIS